MAGGKATHEWPLVGRDVELRRVIDHVGGAEPRNVVVAGPAGVGKSRLADEAARRSTPSRVAVERVRATAASATIPFSAFAHLLPVEVPSGGDPLQLLQHVRQALLDRSGVKGLLLVVDDAHLLDEGSAMLVHQVAAGQQVSLIVTVRTGEPAPDPVQGLWKDELATRIGLPNLSRAAADELVTAVLGGRVERRTRQQLWDLSQGNPLFLRELILGSLERGVLAREGMWRLTERLAPSRRLVEIVGARLNRLDPADREAAELVALGEPLMLGVLAAVAREGAAERLEGGGIVRLERSRRRRQVLLSHPVHAEVLRADVTETGRRRLSGWLADALAATGTRRRGDLLRLAVLRLESGGPYDPEMMVRAAGRALAGLDHELAERLVRAAMANGAEGFEVGLTLGGALAGQNRAGEAEQVLAEAAAAAPEAGARSRVAMARAQNLLYGCRRPREAAEVLRQARGQVTDANWDDELTAMLAILAAFTGDTRAGVEAGQRVLSRPAANPRAVVATLVASTICQVLRGELRGIHRSLETGLRLAAEVGDELPLAGTQLAVTEAGVQWLSGRVADARQRCRDGYRSALAKSQDDLAGVWAAVLAQLLSYGGNVEETLAVASEAAELLRVHDTLGMLPMALGCQAQAAARTGDVSLARRLADEPAFVADESELRSRVFVVRARAWTRAAEGQRSAAAADLADAGRQVVDGGIRLWGAVLLHDVVRLGYPELVTDELTSVANAADGALFELWAAHARALADTDADGLDQVAGRFADHALPLYAAEAAIQAAELHRRAGSARSARRSAAKASAWGSAASVPMAAPSMPLEPLTRREQEVATMAARGLTSPQIAEALSISRRTVDNHLRSVYRKLAIGGRQDLTRVLSPRI